MNGREVLFLEYLIETKIEIICLGKKALYSLNVWYATAWFRIFLKWGLNMFDLLDFFSESGVIEKYCSARFDLFSGSWASCDG